MMMEILSTVMVAASFVQSSRVGLVLQVKRVRLYAVTELWRVQRHVMIAILWLGMAAPVSVGSNPDISAFLERTESHINVQDVEMASDPQLLNQKLATTATPSPATVVLQHALSRPGILALAARRQPQIHANVLEIFMVPSALCSVSRQQHAIAAASVTQRMDSVCVMTIGLVATVPEMNFP